MTLDRYLSSILVQIEDFLGISYLRKAQFFRNLRTYLRSVPIDCLATADYQVERPYFSNGSRDGIRSSKRVCPCESTVGEQISFVCPSIKAFAYDFRCTARTHRKHGHSRSGELIFQAQSLFKGIEVFRIEDGWKGGAINRAILFHSILPHVARVRNLLCQYCNF